jgi:cardiolipin synthase A/B
MLPLGPRLIVEPDEGVNPILGFINSAESSLLIKQFTFTEVNLIAAVIEKKKAGVDVQVMLNAHRSGGDRANDETFEQFRNAGVAVQWANPKFYVTHEKSIVVDEKVALVATFNLTEKYLSRTRDYGVVTYHTHQVRQIVEVFKADWNHLDWDCSA